MCTNEPQANTIASSQLTLCRKLYLPRLMIKDLTIDDGVVMNNSRIHVELVLAPPRRHILSPTILAPLLQQNGGMFDGTG